MLAAACALCACGGGGTDGKLFFMADGAVFAEVSLKGVKNIAPPETEPQKDGYDFAGWYISDDLGQTLSEQFTDKYIPAAGDNFIYAKFTRKAGKLIFMADGSEYKTIVSPAAAEALPVPAPDPQKKGHSFDGWYTSPDGGIILDKAFSDDYAIVDGDNYIYAKFKPDEFTLNFNSAYEFAAGYMKPQSFFYGAGQEIQRLGFSRAGYEFAGWTRVPGGSVQYSDGQKISLEVTKNSVIQLYAVWERDNSKSIINYYEDGVKTDEEEVIRGFLFYGKPLGPDYNGWFHADGMPVAASEKVTAPEFNAYALNCAGLTASGGVIISYTGKNPRFEIPQYYRSVKITEIGERAFYGNRYITEIRIPQFIKSIGNLAFGNCSNLTDLIIESDAPGIDLDTIFTSNAGTLKTIVWVPNNTAGNKPYLNYRAQPVCYDYASNIFPVSAKGASGYVRDGDVLIGHIGNITAVNIPQGVKIISEKAFIYKTMIEEVFLPEGVTHINRQAFYHCTSLALINFPDTLKNIGQYAFSGYLESNRLQSVFLPEGLTRIEDGAFLWAKEVLVVSLPSTLKYLGYLSFGACNKIETFSIAAAEPPEVGSYMAAEGLDIDIFAYINWAKFRLLVPNGIYQSGPNEGKRYLDVYRSAPGFDKYADYIEAYPRGKEAGKYQDGVSSLILDGTGYFTFKDSRGQLSEGIYVLDGNILTLKPVSGNISAAYSFEDRMISFNSGGTDYVLKEPDYYYDDYNWSNLYLFYNGKGTFDMMGYYFHELTWTLDGTVFTLTIDGNNTNEFAGEQTYTGIKTGGRISVTFWLNDWEMEFVFDYVPPAWDLDGYEGQYVCMIVGEYNPLIFVLVLNGNGTGDFYMGVYYYYITYKVSGDIITIDMSGLKWTLEITEDGSLCGAPIGQAVWDGAVWVKSD